jgi:sugar phosphate isomerase/epimerase
VATANTNPRPGRAPAGVGVVTEPLAREPLAGVMDWLLKAAPEVTDLELGAGGYAPTGHCDRAVLLRDAAARRRWQREIEARGLRLTALNAWGNPLHPDPDLAARHDADLRDTIRLAAALGVDRVVALAGCPPGTGGDRVPHFAAGGWLPYLEGVHEGQWQESVLPYWSGLAGFARVEHPRLLVCLELHPGTVVYNVESFERIAVLGDSIAANLDPSHLFWMGMDPVAVVARLGERVGHCHGKDVVFSERNLGLNGLLDRRWPRPPDEMPWNFAVVGRGRDPRWWSAFVAEMLTRTRVRTIAIEHEDPFVDPREGIPSAAALLAGAIDSAGSMVENP